MSDQTKYANQIAVVKQECPDADEGEVGKEFARYEKDFLIPPEDALRSVICLLYTSPSPRDQRGSRMPSSA